MNKILVDLPFRVEDHLAALFGGNLVGAAVEKGVAVAIVVTLVAAAAEVEAAELLALGLLVVVRQVVRRGVTDVDAGRAGSAGRSDYGATAVGVTLVLLRDLDLLAAGDQFRRSVLASGCRARVEEVGL